MAAHAAVSVISLSFICSFFLVNQRDKRACCEGITRKGSGSCDVLSGGDGEFLTADCADNSDLESEIFSIREIRVIRGEEFPRQRRFGLTGTGGEGTLPHGQKSV